MGDNLMRRSETIVNKSHSITHKYFIVKSAGHYVILDLWCLESHHNVWKYPGDYCPPRGKWVLRSLGEMA